MYSHKVVGYGLEKSLDTEGPLSALRMAVKQLKPGHTLVHHSDRGSQYCSHLYVNLLKKKDIQISMTENGDPRENAVAERMNGILKQEYLEVNEINSYAILEEKLPKLIKLYNSERPHSSIGNSVPNKVHQGKMETKRLWKNYW